MIRIRNLYSARFQRHAASVWRRGVDVALTLQQLQANIDSINQAIGEKVSRVRYPDGRDVTYRSMDELLKAKGDIEKPDPHVWRRLRQQIHACPAPPRGRLLVTDESY